MFWKKYHHFIPFILLCVFFLFIVFCYLHNITWDVYSGDIGDLVTAAFVFGVPHPPGYPLLTFLGWVFIHLPFSLPVVTRVGFVSLFASLLGLYFFFRFCLRVSESYLIAVLSTSLLAFSYTYWFLAEIPEVFGLNNFFVIILLCLSCLFYEKKQITYLYLLSFFTGLSLTNQTQIITLFPALLLLVASQIKVLWQSKKSIYLSVLFFVLGLFPYIYIPIAAGGHPVVNWDNASNLPNFVHLLLRQDYQIFSPHAWFLTPRERLPILGDYVASFINNYSWIVIFVGFIGAVRLFMKHKLLFLAFFLAFFVSGPLFIFIIAPPVKSTDALGVLERFYALSFVVFAFLLPFGFSAIEWFFGIFIRRNNKKRVYLCLTLIVFFIVPICMFVYTYPKTDLSKTQIGNDLGRNILSSLPKNSLLFLHADSVTFNTWYVHYVLGVRADISLASIAKSGNDYFQIRMKKAYTKTYKHTFVSEDEMFGLGLTSIAAGAPVFSTSLLPYYLPANYMLIPKGLVYQLVKKETIPGRELYLKEILPFLMEKFPSRDTLQLSEQNLITPDITKFYSDAFLHMGNFLMSTYGDSKNAEKFYSRAMTIDSENSVAYANLASVESLFPSTCSQAEKHIAAAIAYYPIYKQYYISLYQIYDRCHAPKATLEGIRAEYKKIYKADVSKLPVRFELY